MVGLNNRGFGPSGLIFCAFFTFAAMACAGTYSGGSGTAEDPYQIATVEDLIALGQTPADYGYHFVLTADIDLGANNFTTAVIAPDTSSSSDFQGAAFTGFFDGAGHTITNLTIDTLADSDATNDSNNYLGLFGWIGKGGQVRNLVIENTTITGSSNSGRLGGLCAQNGGTIDNCPVTATVSGGGTLGGLCGYNAGNVQNCYAISSVIGGSRIGGLVGQNWGGTVTNSGATGTVTGSGSSIGGLCGYNYMAVYSITSGRIAGCYASVSVTGGDSSNELGGLCGMNLATIETSYATGSVNGGKTSQFLGGLCGQNNSTVSNCYATGTVTAADGATHLGGLCGGNTATVLNCFWDTETSGQITSEGGYSKTTVQMRQESTYFGWNNGAWTIDEEQDYPHLAWENPSGEAIDFVFPRSYAGDGVNQPFEIATAEDLFCLSRRPEDWDKSFVLICDIDMAGIVEYYPIASFTGRFDGGRHTIHNLTIDASVIGNRSQLGLFGCVRSPGEIVRLGLENVDIIGVKRSVSLGGLCGRIQGQYPIPTLYACSVTGAITGGDGSSDLGLLCGTNYIGTIESCYSQGSVFSADGSAYLGGLCGYNGGPARYCYSTASVTGGKNSIYLGGLCGGLIGPAYGAGRIIDCYSTGRVQGGTGTTSIEGLCGSGLSAYRSYWDTETSKIKVGSMGTGLPTAQMKIRSNFGWDFSDMDGDPADWRMPSGDYPRLVWEYISPFEGGEGTQASPYRISTAAQLMIIGSDPYLLEKFYVLDSDIDLGAIILTTAVLAPDQDNSNLGFQGAEFTGVFDGAGHTIMNLSINTLSDDDPSNDGNGYLGLFGRIGINGLVRNLEIENASITGGIVTSNSSVNLGALCGSNNGTLRHCSTTGHISGLSGLGGICGDNEMGNIFTNQSIV